MKNEEILKAIEVVSPLLKSDVYLTNEEKESLGNFVLKLIQELTTRI